MRTSVLAVVTGLTLATAACGGGTGFRGEQTSAPQPVATTASQTDLDMSQPSTETAPEGDLPRTASPLPLIGLSGVVALTTAAVLRVARQTR